MDDPSTLTQYGALGVLALSAVSVAAALWRRVSAQTENTEKLQTAHAAQLEKIQTAHAKQIEDLGEAHAKRLEAITSEHKAEMKSLLERLIESHGAQMRDYHKMTEHMGSVLDSMTRKFERPSRRPGT